ncbi:hypothetical protein RDABS01_020126 [Bienertia sinuspersici]
MNLSKIMIKNSVFSTNSTWEILKIKIKILTTMRVNLGFSHATIAKENFIALKL